MNVLKEIGLIVLGLLLIIEPAKHNMEPLLLDFVFDVFCWIIALLIFKYVFTVRQERNE